MAVQPQVLARGPWDPSAVEVAWCADPYEPDADASAEADRILDGLRRRGSPSYDGLAARLAGFGARGRRLRLELQPIRWALRLLPDDAGTSVSALCVVRDAAGRWLAGRRAEWVASWAGRWALGAGGSVELAENPLGTLARELEEEWSIRSAPVTLEALVKLASGMVLIVGQTRLPDGAGVTPDHEHDAYAWWPAAVAQWPAEADPALRMIGTLLADA